MKGKVFSTVHRPPAIVLWIFMSTWIMTINGRDAITRNCSHYEFNTVSRSWSASQKHCQTNGGNLVSMETEDEWKFINTEIQKIRVGKNDEWYIGLMRYKTTEWKWMNYQSLTFNNTWPWQPNQPSGDGTCVVMARNWPENTQGLFGDLGCYNKKLFICEYETQESKIHWCGKPVHTAATPTSLTTTATTLLVQPTATAGATIRQELNLTRKRSAAKRVKANLMFVTTLPTIQQATTKQLADVAAPSQSSGGSKNSSQPFPVMVVIIVLGVLLVICMCLVIIACFWKRRGRDEKHESKKWSTKSQIPMTVSHRSETDVEVSEHVRGGSFVAFNNVASNQQQGPTYASIDRNHDNLPGVAIVTQPAQEVVYASVNKNRQTNTKNPKELGENPEKEKSEKQDEHPPMCEPVVYAAVDKSMKRNIHMGNTNKSPQEPQVLYVELADFNKNTEQVVPKHDPYSPVEYAVIVGKKKKH